MGSAFGRAFEHFSRQQCGGCRQSVEHRCVTPGVRSCPAPRVVTRDLAVGAPEVRENLRNRRNAAQEWKSLRARVVVEKDEFIFHWPLVFDIAKDKPVLVTALACADVLLTLDRRDFAPLIGQTVYGLRVRTPRGFLREEREAGR
jgi:hypothetical protein